MHRAISVVETAQLLQVQVISGSKVPLIDHTFNPYTESRGQGIFDKKYNHNILRLRDSGNSTPLTVNPLTVRGSHKSLLYDYNIITLIMLHTYQRYPPRYW